MYVLILGASKNKNSTESSILNTNCSASNNSTHPTSSPFSTTPRNTDSLFNKFKGIIQSNVSQYNEVLKKWVGNLTPSTRKSNHKRSHSLSAVHSYITHTGNKHDPDRAHKYDDDADNFNKNVSISAKNSTLTDSMLQHTAFDEFDDAHLSLYGRSGKLIRELIELRQLTGFLYVSAGHLLEPN